MTTLVHQLRFEQKMFWRSREAAVFIFVFPLLLYALLGSVYGDEIDGIPAQDVLLVGLFGYGAATTAFGGLAITLVIRREAGALKRLRATPLQPARIPRRRPAVDADDVRHAVGRSPRARRTRVRRKHAPELGGLRRRDRARRGRLRGLGFGAAALIRSAEGVSAVVNVVILPMAFLSGSFGPTADFPRALQAIADVLPLTYFLDIVYGVYLDGESLFADPKALGIVVAWGVAGFAVAARRFGWVPRER